MSDALRIAVGAIIGATTGITLVIIVPAAWRALRATFKRRETRTLGPARSAADKAVEYDRAINVLRRTGRDGGLVAELLRLIKAADG